jgi:hypothetical protein
MCALKVSRSTAKGKRMPARDRLPSIERGVRLLRLAATVAIVIALIAIVRIAKGELAGGSHVLILIAIALGACVLAGMTMLILPYFIRQKRQKDENDPRP